MSTSRLLRAVCATLVVSLFYFSQVRAEVADPGAFPDNTDLTTAFPGVTLLFESPLTTGSISNYTDPGSGVSFFLQKYDAGGVDDTWTNDPGFPRFFRADFDTPVSYVSIDIYKSNICDNSPGITCSGVLEAYNSTGTLIDTANTGPLTGYWTDPPVLATITRGSADIAYIRVYGTNDVLYGGGIVLSTIRYSVVQTGGSDVDHDGIPDIQDQCPADPANACIVEGSAASEISASTGGTIITPDGNVSLGIDPDDLAVDATISVTEILPDDPNVDLSIGAGTALSVYNLEPDGLQFNSPITLTVTADVTALDVIQRNNMDLYRFEDTDNDTVADTFVPLNANCSVLEDPIGTFTAICIVEITHFSTYAIILPQDSDGDGVPDNFNGQSDQCLAEDATGFDVDTDGCIDSFHGLIDLVSKLVIEQVIPVTMENSLLSKVSNAEKSYSKENVCAAKNELDAFKNQVDAQTGKKISIEAATLVENYADSVAQYLLSHLPSGVTCS